MRKFAPYENFPLYSRAFCTSDRRHMSDQISFVLYAQIKNKMDGRYVSVVVNGNHTHRGDACCCVTLY